MAAERDRPGDIAGDGSGGVKGETREISLKDGAYAVQILESGEGDPVLYLHGVIRVEPDPLVGDLARRHRVVAPLLPGYGGSTGVEKLTDIHDLAIYYVDLIDALGLDRMVLVGHSLGGMFAAELAAVAPQRFSHVVLLAPYGLWDDAMPTFDFFPASAREMAEAFYSDSKKPGAMAIAQTPQEAATEVDPDTAEGQAVIGQLVERAKTMSSAVRYLWPIPDRGLSRRLYRLRMPTLIVWGEDDGVIDPGYARRFSELIPGAETVTVAGAAHMLNDEKPKDVGAQIERFIGA